MSTAATTLPTGTWNVDPSHSRVGFSVKHLGISNVRGEFHDFDGQFVIAEDGTATASGTVRVASIDTNESGRDGHLKSADFFDGEIYPEITFQSTSITATYEDTYEITGDLTMHGVTNPITLTVDIGGSDADLYGNTRIGLEATAELSRSAYGMKFNAAIASGNMMVSDKVKLDLDIQAVKAA